MIEDRRRQIEGGDEAPLLSALRAQLASAAAGEAARRGPQQLARAPVADALHDQQQLSRGARLAEREEVCAAFAAAWQIRHDEALAARQRGHTREQRGRRTERRTRDVSLTVGCQHAVEIVIGIAAIFYGVEHFLHPVNVPGVPLEKFMPVWIPGPRLIAYLTGAVLLTAGVSILLARKTRTAATYLGGWILLLVIFIYGPILVVSLLDPSTDVKVEGLNYFFDTLLFAGAILALASATPSAD